MEAHKIGENMKAILTVVAVYAAVIGLACGGAILSGILSPAQAHDGQRGHNRAQRFHFNYDAEHGVYCGWRHAYEGISCVKVGD